MQIFITEWLPLIKDSTISITAVIASFVGIKGLGTWQRQLKGNTEYELAKKILRSIYELRDAISYVRNPIIRYSPEPDLPQEELQELSTRDKEWVSIAQVYQKRWDKVQKASIELDALSLEAQVVWGPKIAELFKPMDKSIAELNNAIKSHLRMINPKTTLQERDMDRITKIDAIIYEEYDLSDDKYKQNLEKQILQIEELIKPHISQFHR